MAAYTALYPFYGALFIIRHSFVWKRLLKNMGKFVGLSLLFLLVLYTKCAFLKAGRALCVQIAGTAGLACAEANTVAIPQGMERASGDVWAHSGARMGGPRRHAAATGKRSDAGTIHAPG